MNDSKLWFVSIIQPISYTVKTIYVYYVYIMHLPTKTNSKTKDLISLKRVKYIEGFKVRTCNKTNLSTLFC